ncbi:MAG: DUF5127 domain-containing protein, partial [Flavitalea sp.]
MLKQLFALSMSAMSFGLLNAQELRAPAYPLITHDPYFCIWSNTNELTGSATRHWTGVDQSIVGTVTVDGKTFRFLGDKEKAFASVLKTSDEMPAYQSVYTETEPSGNWKEITYQEGGWKKGTGSFGDNRKAGTKWTSKDLWVRRTFTLAMLPDTELFLKLIHDDNIEVYLNGEEIFKTVGWTNKYIYPAISKAIVSKMKAGKNVLAIHVANTAGGQELDAGIVSEIIDKRDPAELVAVQKSVKVTALSTVYAFTAGAVDLSLTFTSPLLAKDLELLARPVSYITTSVKSNDGKNHKVQLNFGVSTDLAVNTQVQPVKAEKYVAAGLNILKAGTVEQPVLKKKGDDVRIDWGYLYVAVSTAANATQSIKPTGQPAIKGNTLTGKHISLDTRFDLGEVGRLPVGKVMMIGYDDLESIQYFGTNLKPWWKKDGITFEQLLAKASKEYSTVTDRCFAFDRVIHEDALKAGGEQYAKLCVLAYRQSLAGHKLVKSPQGELLFLSKENFSNGSINTVDITYPSAPLYL